MSASAEGKRAETAWLPAVCVLTHALPGKTSEGGEKTWHLKANAVLLKKQDIHSMQQQVHSTSVRCCNTGKQATYSRHFDSN